MYNALQTIRTFFVLFFALCIFSGCKKFLDKKSDTSVVVPETLSDLQALLDNSTKMNLQRTPNYSESSCDDYFLPEATYNGFDDERQRIYRWQPVPYNFQNDWSIGYEPIYISNYCLEQLSKISTNSSNLAQWHNIRGSALFYRSYYFLGLTWSHAKAYDKDSSQLHPGIVLRLSSDFNEPSKRATVKECYDRIVLDTKAAINDLPDLPIHVLRPSKAAAYGLLARSYLSMQQYDSAFKYAGLCLQIKSNLIDYNADADLNGTVNATTPFKRFNKETIFYSEMSSTYTTQSISRARVDTNLFSSYDANDLRKRAFYRLVSPYYQFKGSYTGNNNQYFTGITTAEIFLIRAECSARLSNQSAAMSDLNILMQKRWSNTVPFPVFTAVNPADALTKVLAERRKELYMRGLRWMDIKRLNKENANIILQRKIAGTYYTLSPNAGFYALPLPADIVQLTGIPQNN